MSNQDWWARQFNQPVPAPQQPVYPPQYQQPYPPQVPSPYPPAQFQQAPVYPPQQYPQYPLVQQPYPQQYQQPGYPPQPVYPQQPGMRLAEAQGFENKPPASAMQNSRCPECNSGNYMKRGSVQTMNGSVDAWSCYDCGYPLKQTTSGMSGSGPISASKQIATGGWNPQGIIGRL